MPIGTMVQKNAQKTTTDRPGFRCEDEDSVRLLQRESFLHEDLSRRPAWEEKCIRFFDFMLATAGLVFSSPLWALCAIGIKLEDGGPVFYSQERVGNGQRTFRILKFRSMVKDAEKNTGPVQACAHDCRVTKIGKILRGSAMDELPQLLSIARGDMSFVGPRALRPQEKEVAGDGSVVNIDTISGYRQRCCVRPGLTGLAQVYLPSDAPRYKKFRYDALYIRRKSVSLNCKLIMVSFLFTAKGKWESRGKKI